MAQRRGRIPRAFPIPQPSRGFNPDSQYLLHSISFGEANGFDPACYEKVAEELLENGFSTRNCSMFLESTQPLITFEWKEGAPPRRFLDRAGNFVPVQKAFPLREGEFCRIQYNARFSGYDCGNWWYEHSIINFASGTPETRRFLDSEPDTEFRGLARLR